MYADDTLLMSSAKSSQDSISKCQMLLDKIAAWCDKNKLTINIKKTKCMVISSGEIPIDINLSIKGTKLESVKAFEYLGMHIYNKLTMSKHVCAMLKKGEDETRNLV